MLRFFITLCLYGYDIRKIMLSKAKKINFLNKAEALEEINTWFSKKTNGKIEKMLSEIQDRTQMIISSALYFKAPWTTPFMSYLTQKRDFTLANGQIKPVDMMLLKDKQTKYKYRAL